MSLAFKTKCRSGHPESVWADYVVCMTLAPQMFIQAELGSTASQGQPREKRAGAEEGRYVEGLSDWSLPCQSGPHK